MTMLAMVNYLAVLAAAIASFLAGAVWYGVLGKAWVAALGWTDADMRDAAGNRRVPVGPMIISFIAELVMATMLFGILVHLGGANVRRGIIAGVLVWIGFVVTTIVTNNAYAKRKWSLTMIDSAHWLLVLIVQGAVLGLFG
jgi:hypothetical protein